MDVPAAGDDDGGAGAVRGGGHEVDEGVLVLGAQGRADLLGVGRVEQPDAGFGEGEHHPAAQVARRGVGVVRGTGRAPLGGQGVPARGGEQFGDGAAGGGGVQDEPAAGVEGPEGVLRGPVGDAPAEDLLGEPGGESGGFGGVLRPGLEQRGAREAAHGLQPEPAAAFAVAAGQSRAEPVGLREGVDGDGPQPVLGAAHRLDGPFQEADGPLQVPGPLR